jgi:OOP family OmpA-OmpF porin
MKNITMTTINKLILAAFIPLTIAPMMTMAAEKSSSEWVSTAANKTWKDSSGECWRSSSWTPANATEECDPQYFKKAEVAPAPVVVAAAPAPVVVAPAPVQTRTVTKKVSFSAEDLFAFDKSELKPEGKEKLDQLAKDMRSTDNESIIATGHTDRIGNKKYNQKLSERRANTVRDYLIAGGISGDQIRAEGRGETDPVTKSGDCKGPVSKKLKACLQADRRVDVEVAATKTTTTTVSMSSGQ